MGDSPFFCKLFLGLIDLVASLFCMNHVCGKTDSQYLKYTIELVIPQPTHNILYNRSLSVTMVKKTAGAGPRKRKEALKKPTSKTLEANWSGSHMTQLKFKKLEETGVLPHQS